MQRLRAGAHGLMGSQFRTVKRESRMIPSYEAMDYPVGFTLHDQKKVHHRYN